VTPFGDRALRFAVADRAAFDALRRVPGVSDVVLAESVGLVIFEREPDARAVEAALAVRVATTRAVTQHTIGVVYDGVDLDEVAQATGLSRDEVIRRHVDASYEVAMLGFLPGFGYLRGLPRELHLPRRSPRPRVPRGAVGIAAHYTGIYPFEAAGGWHLIGRAPLFEPFAERAVLSVGDRVRFERIDADVTPTPRRSWDLPEPKGACIEIARVQGLALLVDLGRPGRMHEGIAPGGPLVRNAHRDANAAVGNAPGACAIELSGACEIVARGAKLRVGDLTLRNGERHAFTTGRDRRVAYIAVEGGLDAPIVLGSRSPILAAGIGRPLRRGDRIAIGGAARDEALADVATPNATRRTLGIVGQGSPIEVVPGPDDAGVDLFAEAWRISPTSDRAGTRLEGRPHAASGLARPSTPMCCGAIELTPAGPIVLGPDHPTTGGYPVIGVLHSRSRDAFFERRLGSTVQFARAV
jgi:KipI family sensor histidine kinase inhibitor